MLNKYFHFRAYNILVFCIVGKVNTFEPGTTRDLKRGNKFDWGILSVAGCGFPFL